ncbi:MAG: DUF5716 family protein [Mobilitalea sp.]
MDTPKKLIVGCDLCNDFTQISCYSYKTLEPIPICIREGEEYRPIPTVLCVKKETKQWLFGEEAIDCAESGEGILIDNLMTKLPSGEAVEILGQPFGGVALLEKFLRKALMLIKNYFPTEIITKMVVTTDTADPQIVEKVYEALSQLGLEKDRVEVMSHAGAYLYYALCQEKALWVNDVGLFDFEQEGMHFYQIKVNRRTQPMIAGLCRTDYSEIMNWDMLKTRKDQLPYAFQTIANTALYKQIISTLYFTGTGFEGGWADEIIKSLSKGRRAFYGQNLYTKGACYAAKELSGDRQLKDFLLLNDDMIMSSVGLRVFSDTRLKEVPFIEAGATWYQVDESIEVIPEGIPELEIIIKNIMTKDILREKVLLNELPKRPDRMTRLKITLTCKDKSTGIITVTDLGFGEIYPETGTIMEFEIEI